MPANFLGRFSGWQLTTMVCAGLLAPTAMVAAVTYSNVAVVNPTSGVAALIDAGGSLHTTDIMGQYRSNPVNLVDIRIPMAATGCESATYAIPAGKALIITSITGDFYSANGTSAAAGFWVMGGATCSGNYFINEYTPIAAASAAVAVKNYEYGAGVPIPAGTISFYSDNDLGWTVIHGYLVPASLVLSSSYQYPTHAPANPHAPSASAK